MFELIVQPITEGGTPEEIARLWRLCRYSNDFARATYGMAFLRLYKAEPETLAALDLRPTRGKRTQLGQ
ncbi:hypothetical protein [Methylobacterium planeticum]|uniref:Uncharacterized protein n=1 Tax=Methylobacterium planeticum TaxID=2615211 RepID=A0A6N6MH29_9HYPH|nr:hypothetical protein [Methylobacterium planeticum]KAB1068737.1 hypothetical protein F6X51_26365 [Methylobacterium planeticum]